MVSQAELIFKGYHSLVPGLILIFIDGMGPFKYIIRIVKNGHKVGQDRTDF